MLSRRLHNAYGNRVSVVNEAIGGNRVVNPVVFPATSGQAATDRLNRDVLGLSGLTHVVWLEGINDLGGGHTVASIEAGYQSIVATLHADRIKVMGATMTSALYGHAQSRRGLVSRLYRRWGQRPSRRRQPNDPQHLYPDFRAL